MKHMDIVDYCSTFNFHLSAKALGQSKFTIGYWPMAKFLALEEDKH